MFGFGRPTSMVSREEALPGRSTPVAGPPTHHLVLDTPAAGPFPEGTQVIYLAGGCFWGLERIFWKMPGVVSTAAGYMGGFTPYPTYEETCSGRTGHTETVMVAYDPSVVDAETLLRTFWENHDPTTANRQGNDVGTQYRSAIFWTTDEQRRAAEATRDAFADVLARHGHGPITTQIEPADGPDGVGPFYFAEGYHQQYLQANPGGYCNHGPNGYSCPTGLLSKDGVPAQTHVAPPAAG